MLQFTPMTGLEFDRFKVTSQTEYASSVAQSESILMALALKFAEEQFSRLVPEGPLSPGQLFYTVTDGQTGQVVGYVWLGVQDRFGRKVLAINDIFINEQQRGQGLGKRVMAWIEQEALRVGASRIRLHVFQHNERARALYEKMGFRVSSTDMYKALDSSR